MEIVVCKDWDDLKNHHKNPVSVFDSEEFLKTVEHNADEVYRLAFRDSRFILTLVTGKMGSVLSIPWSSSYSFFCLVKTNPKVQDYGAAIVALQEFALGKGIEKIRWTLPPFFYHSDAIAKFCNILTVEKFELKKADLNFHVDLRGFSPGMYEMSIDPKGRQKLRAALKHPWVFVRETEAAAQEQVYRVIEENRTHRGFPLHMSYERVARTTRVVPSSFFSLRAETGVIAASAICYHVQPKIAQVIFWGNVPGTEELRPMNVLAYRVLKYYAEQGFNIVDTGTSTEEGIANIGLSDFKQAIGGQATVKLTYEKILTCV